MSSPAPRNFRPKLHFTPPSMWMNDPNGLFYTDGTYHLYYQYNPGDTVWGPMHWGHAVSKDLYHWEHCPIAMKPDELGTIFSGCAVLDIENVSGFGENGRHPLLIFYTNHGECECQSMAYSLDGGMTFTRYSGNPILGNPGVNDYRDPKVFRNPVRGGYSMIVSAHDRAMFYHSTDLKHWEKTGECKPTPEQIHNTDIWECPDIFPMECGGKTVWVLVVSMIFFGEGHENHMLYLTGTFDGDTFRPDEGAVAERVDCGFDCYAGSTYWGTDDRILISWENCPDYAGQVPTGQYCGQMSLPRVLHLQETPAGKKLAAHPFGMEKIFEDAKPFDGCLTGETFVLRITGEGSGSVTLENDSGECVTFGVDEENHVYVDRSASSSLQTDNPNWPLMQKSRQPRFYHGCWTIDVVFDVSVLELYCDDGTRCFSDVLFPTHPYEHLTVTGDCQVCLNDFPTD